MARKRGQGYGWYTAVGSVACLFLGFVVLSLFYGLDTGPTKADGAGSSQSVVFQQTPPAQKDLSRAAVAEGQWAADSMRRASEERPSTQYERQGVESEVKDDLRVQGTGAGRCRAPSVRVSGCDGSPPVLNPDVVRDYDTFIHLMVEGLKKDCIGSDRLALTKALTLMHNSDVGGNNWWLEFGAASGYTARVTSSQLKKLTKGEPHTRLHSFDCFLGLPERWLKGYLPQGFAPGAFTQKGQPPYQDSHVAWEIGYFNETLPAFVRKHLTRESRLAWVHVDPDLYSSAHTIMTELGPYLGHGTVIPFHELVNYPKYREGEMLALWEWFSGPHGKCIEILGGPAGSNIKEHFTCGNQCNPRDNGAEDVALRILGKADDV